MLEEKKDQIPTSSRANTFQIFQVKEIKCHALSVHVISGQNISKGWFGNLFDRPDPYLVLWTPGAPHGRRKTRTVKNTHRPVWDQCFDFMLDPQHDTELRVHLMDRGAAVDQLLGKVRVDISELPLDKELYQELRFPHGSKVSIKLTRKEDTSPDLRLSCDLSEEENNFLDRRRVRVKEALETYLGGEQAPRHVGEVPRVAVLGSGGGFRAMVAFSSVLKTLHEMGVFPCVTYLASLSGSSWYLSDLYSHPEFPTKSPGDLQLELQRKVTGGWKKVLCPKRMFRYLKAIHRKHKTGQPVSFTDLFGHMVGDLLLGERKTCTLSEQSGKLTRGELPLPMYTCLQVKKDVSARVYQDWLEFTPYEVGFSKHGASMKPPLFGNKLYLGRVTTPYKELPLHYLQGVWGSAYTIFFRRVIESGRRDALNPQQEDADDDSRLLRAGQTFKNSLSSRDDPKDPSSSSEGTMEGDEDSEVCTSSETETSSRQDLEEQRPQEKANDVTLLSLIMARCLHSTKKLRRGRKWNFRRKLSRARSGRKKRKRDRTFWQMILSKLLRGRLFDSRSGRAGVVFNPVRGLQFCSPCAPYVGNTSTTTPDDDVDFQGFYEPLTAHTKKLYLVDSGLTFNLPFPALLRPQRDVDVFLAFEFSNRAEDESSPFGELLLAEKWARLRNASFPPVSQQVEEFLKHPLRECYLFEDTEDPCCPVILFFVLINKCFRTHKDVDVLRATQEEKDFSDFEIFDDPADPFSSFNFRYSQLQFDRLTRLVEFNTRLYEPMIRGQIEGAVLKKRRLLDKSADHRSPI